MKQYKHPTLGRKTQYIPANKNLCKYIVVDRLGNEIIDFIIVPDLLALGFEEVVEEERDWIDEAFDDYWANCSMSTKEECLTHFRNVLPKHMPKQKKYISQYVLDYCEGYDAILSYDTLMYFLRDHDLLEE